MARRTAQAVRPQKNTEERFRGIFLTVYLMEEWSG